MIKLKRIGSALLWLALFALCVLLLVTLLGRLRGQATGAKLFGYSTAVVTSGSMSGSIEVGDMVVYREEPAYAAGDVITFLSPGGSLVTHRIVMEDEAGYTTRGDANNANDPQPVEPADIQGRVVLVAPRVGGFVTFARSPLGLGLLAGAAVLLVAGIARTGKKDA